MRGTFFVSLVVLLLSPVFALGGTSGKIKGKITDKTTSEALVGATVIVAGTSLGASVDVNGEYVILNVPAGTYAIEANFVGYQKERKENIQVNSDLTTEVNFALAQLTEGVSMKEVVIQVERPLVNKDATNAVRIQTGDDVKNLPIRGVTDAIVLSPGVVQQNGNIYIRGGRAEEVGYYLEGANTRNVMNGANVTTVIPEALEEFQVQAGGFNAQYGGANSGIIRQTLRSGTQTYKASLLAETDNFTPQGKQALGTYSYGYSDYVLTLSGPIISDKVRLFVAGENRFDRDFSTQFWDGFTATNLLNTGQTPADTIPLLSVPSGNIPGEMRNRYTVNGTVTFDLNPLLFRIGGSFTRSKQQGGVGGVVGRIFDFQRQGISDNSDALLNLKMTHFINPTTLYEINFNYNDVRAKTTDPDFGDSFLLYNDSIATAAHGYQYRSYTQGPLDYYFYGFTFNQFGAPQTGYSKDKQSRIAGSVDFVTQIGTVHEIRVGGSFEHYTVRHFNTGTQNLLTFYRANPDQARTPGYRRDFLVARQGGVNNYGYDVYGNELNYNFNPDDTTSIDGAKVPTYFAGYVQDKLEFSDFVMNAGIRFDYIDNDDFKYVNDPVYGVFGGALDPSVDANSFWIRPTGIAKKKAFMALEPRLGFSFPVTDRTVFHLQYGKFVQAPALNQLYTGRGVQAVVFTGGNYIPNPIGFGLDPERTTQYEVGFTQQFSDVAAFDMTAYYKDVSGQIQVVRQVVVSGSVAHAYNSLANGDFVTTKGFELNLRLRRSNRVQAQINYTYSDAKGTGSASNSAVSSLENGTLYPTVISPLDFEQTHRGSINFDYRFTENDGGPILERLGLNVLFNFNSGHPYTLSTGSIGQQGPSTGALIESDARNAVPLEPVNTSTTPWFFDVDLRLDKTVDLGPLSANFYIYVQNLFDTKNVVNVYRRTGNASDDGFLSDPNLSSKIVAALGPRYVELYNAINLLEGQAYRNVAGLPLWGTPRQIRFGVKLEY